MTKNISFYSFKGGTGRSTGLCNVAYCLAEKGASVGCIDFDVEAAGLNFIFDIPPGRFDKSKKIQHFLIPNIRKNIESFDKYVMDLNEIKYENTLDGELYLIPSAIDADLTADLPDSMSLMPIIDELLMNFEENYSLDYLLIDSRSGVSNFAVPSLANSDEVAIFFRWGRQHREGTSFMIPWLNNFLVAFGQPDLFSVASNIPSEISEEEVQEYVNKRLGEYVKGYSIIRETDLLKREEQVLVNSQPDAEVAGDYRELTEHLSDKK